MFSTVLNFDQKVKKFVCDSKLVNVSIPLFMEVFGISLNNRSVNNEKDHRSISAIWQF